MSIKLIFAISDNFVIGNNNTLPWHCSSDLKYFKSMTEGQTVVMGKNTWDSLPDKYKPLPNRRNIVISSKGIDLPTNDNLVVYNSVEDIIKNEKSFWVIGGKQVIQSFINKDVADEIHMTLIKEQYIGDCSLNLAFLDNYKIKEFFDLEDNENQPKATVYIFNK